MTAPELIQRARKDLGFTPMASGSFKDGVWIWVEGDRIHIGAGSRDQALHSLTPSGAWAWLVKRFPVTEGADHVR